MSQMTILVGTVGQGIMRSTDSGKAWGRVGIRQGMHSDAVVRALVNHPHNPEITYAGSDRGLYRSNDAGETWKLIDCPLSRHNVWALAIDPKEPAYMFAGTGTPKPPGMFRSMDGGVSWEQRPIEVAAECAAVGIPRTTGIAIDPMNRDSVWMSIEVDGVRHSTDRGETWQTLGNKIPNPDAHNVLVVEGPPKTIIVVVNRDLFTSTDDGMSWKAHHLKSSFPTIYPRGIAVQPGNGKTVFLTIGDATPGTIGTVMRSQDAAATWEELSLPVPANSAMWTVHMQPTNPKRVFAGSRYGYLYQSEDEGTTWTKLSREFSEISSVVWIPN